MHLPYRPDIDGLRAFAVTSVVIFHAFPNLIPGGFVGVDVFFVISGFLISGIIFREIESSSFSFLDFYARRIKRIFPALITVLVSAYAFGWFFLFSDDFRRLGAHIFRATLFLSNLLLMREAGYFDNAAETKPLLHLWSLAIEEQFYLAWPLIVWVFWRVKALRFPLIALLTLSSLVWNIYHRQPASFSWRLGIASRVGVCVVDLCGAKCLVQQGCIFKSSHGLDWCNQLSTLPLALAYFGICSNH